LFAELLASLEERKRQRETITRLQDSSLRESGGMVYGSTVMAELLEQVKKIARTDAPLLISGETGTGKELMAKFVHEHSPRATKPFRAVNCGAIPENLIESELFGHEKGAFTGATRRKAGLFEAVNTGTVFLDEVGELPLQLQVKLLRVLQESEVVRLGGSETLRVDVRVIAATNRDLAAEVKEGRFRQDLFFRLNVLTANLPPLREREQDILVLADHFVRRYCDQFGLPQKTLTAEARNALAAHHWPGNVRELENVVQKAVLLSSSTRIGATELSFEQMGATRSLKEARAEAEERIIRQTLGRTQGNISLTAKILRIDRKWLMKKMDELGVSADEFRGHTREFDN
jgi:DNA-binding NtrC family response regulator